MEIIIVFFISHIKNTSFFSNSCEMDKPNLYAPLPCQHNAGCSVYDEAPGAPFNLPVASWPHAYSSCYFSEIYERKFKKEKL